MSTVKPSQLEEEYFAREDAEKKRKLALEYHRQMVSEERDHLRSLHQNHCPKCGHRLHEIALHGVQAMRCFSCHGVFLTSDDLKKIAAEPGYWDRMLHFFVAHDYSKPHE